MSDEEQTKGGPAFPTSCRVNDQDRGMSLRDYFAAQAMAAYISGPDIPDCNQARQVPKAAALWAYEQADAMEAILDSSEEKEIEIMPNGEVRAVPKGTKSDAQPEIITSKYAAAEYY